MDDSEFQRVLDDVIWIFPWSAHAVHARVAISPGLNKRSLRAASALAGARVCCAVQAALLGTTCVGQCCLELRGARKWRNQAGELTCLECLTARWIRLSFRLIRPRGVLRRHIVPVEGSCIASPRPATKFALAGISGVIHYASFHRSPAEAHRTASIIISHYSASPQRRAPLRHKVSTASSQAAAARRRGETSSDTKGRCSARAAATTPFLSPPSRTRTSRASSRSRSTRR